MSTNLNSAQNPLLPQLLAALNRLLGFHRQLLDAVRLEKEALANADLKGIQESTCTKEALIQGIRQAEQDRAEVTSQLAVLWRKPLKDLTLPNIAIAIQGVDSKGAEQLRSLFNALTIHIQRITDQSRYNAELIQKSLSHVLEMKRNVLGESVPHSNTYSSYGQKVNHGGGARLISKEV